MVELNHRDRVVAAVNLEEPDQVPWCAYFGFAPSLYNKLCNYYSIPSEPVDPIFPELYRKLGFDVIMVNPSPPDGYPRLFPDGSYCDHFGVTFGRFMGFSTRPIEHPLANANVDGLENYEFPDPESLSLGPIDRFVRKDGDEYALMSGFSFTLFERAWTLRGFAQILADFYLYPSFVERLLDKITDYGVELARRIVEKPIDIYWIGDDYSDQRGMLMSPAIWRKFIKPRLARIADVARRKDIPTFLHTDGNPSDILDDLAEVGITVINPVQPLAIDPSYVKDKLGDRLCLFGTIDIQHTLPFGSPQDVKKEVITRIETCGYGGGLILSPSHAVPPDVPLANTVALVDAVRRYGKYPTSHTE
ncbi:MAG: hypothetical protein OEY31_00190 [Candidatus Bathyarchaeota archaeon]|nr:hypothetical protein [Candidatus Bathyarchaeota archaeon]